MTSLEIMADSPSARATDFVSTDAAQLASHMNHCAVSRGRLFGLYSAAEFLHALARPRIVTVAVLAAIGLSLLVVA
jgi:hypothetical protein